MAALVHAIHATNGKLDGEAAVKSLEGWKFDSPQGPIEIDPQTRDIIMNEYLDEVVMGPDNKLHQKVLATLDQVKDQCKALEIGRCKQ
jgi:branched-chain amino acid transport system substrate-binding protein